MLWKVYYLLSFTSCGFTVFFLKWINFVKAYLWLLHHKLNIARICHSQFCMYKVLVGLKSFIKKTYADIWLFFSHPIRKIIKIYCKSFQSYFRIYKYVITPFSLFISCKSLKTIQSWYLYPQIEQIAQITQNY